MGNKTSTIDPLFVDNTDTNTTRRKQCDVCYSKLSSVSNNQRCMTCGTICCQRCIETTMDSETNTYTVICDPCDQKKKNQTANFMSANLMKIVKNHKHNGRELLVYGYIRVLWVLHCLLHDFDYTSRFPSNDVVQCISAWLYIQESFDKTSIDKTIKLSNANQCIERISMNDKFVSHIFGTSSIKSPGCKTWKFQLLECEKDDPNFVLGVVIENQINQIGTFDAATFNESSKYGFGISWSTLSHTWPYFRLKVNDIIVMTLDFKRNEVPYEETNQLTIPNCFRRDDEKQDGTLQYKVYRDGKCVSESHRREFNCEVSGKYAYKLAVAMHQNDKLTLLEEWW